MRFITFLRGSTSSDVQSDTDAHPFEPCPGSPNCIIRSVRYALPAKAMFAAAHEVLKKIDPHKLQVNSQSLQIDAVFRIRLFGFKDDMNIMIESAGNTECRFHIKSASRVGRGDFGVNRRRIRRILKQINSKT